MVTLGAVFRRHGPRFLAQFGAQLSDSQRQAMRAISQCRTEALGGHLYACSACETTRYSYHSCRNRHCPTCQQDAGERWLAQQQGLLLPVPYFLVTFTLPGHLRALARQHPETVYSLLFRASAAALQQLAQDPRFLGGQIGMLGVLQTWTRDLRYHPHIHYLVPALGLAPDGKRWLVGRQKFFVHTKPLAKLFRAKMRAALRRALPQADIPPTVWAKAWVVDCQPVGDGAAALKYLAPYIFRIALSNNRIERLDDEQVTFRYTEASTGQTKRCNLPAESFIRRFLSHVLPKGFVKVRYYGLLRVGNQHLLEKARAALVPQAKSSPGAGLAVAGATEQPSKVAPDVTRCPNCGRAMHLVQVLPRQRTERTEPAPSAVCSRGPPGRLAGKASEVSDQMRRAYLVRSMQSGRADQLRHADPGVTDVRSGPAGTPQDTQEGLRMPP